MRIIEDIKLLKTTHILPRSKKKRIRKKWINNPSKKKISPDTNCYVRGNDIFFHPIVAAEIRKNFNKDFTLSGFNQLLFGNGMFGI